MTGYDHFGSRTDNGLSRLNPGTMGRAQMLIVNHLKGCVVHIVDKKPRGTTKPGIQRCIDICS